MTILAKKSTLALVLASVLAFPLFALAAPGNVKNVSATAESASSIKLTWGAVEGASKYRVYYNSEADGGSVQNGETFAYVNEVATPDNTASYSLTGLSPNTKYYMALTALNAQEEESESYSLEVNATTPAGSEQTPPAPQATTAGDTLAPMVLKVIAEDSAHVLVGFSEPVVLPSNNPQGAFTIQEQINANNSLEVKSATLYASDSTGKTILLETAPQKKNTNYVLTAGIQIKDIAGNAINSGASDSGLFVGTDKAAATSSPSEPNTSNKGVECGIDYANDPSKNTAGAKECFEVSFQTCTPATYTKVSVVNQKQTDYHYEIVKKGTGVCTIESKYLKNEANGALENQSMTCDYDNSKAFTAAETALLTSFSSTTPLGNCTGALYASLTSSTTSSTTSSPPSSTTTNPAAPDTTAPEEVTDLRLSFSQMANSALYAVGLNWIASQNSAGDLFDQMLYQSTDLGKTYDAGKSLGKTTVAYDAQNLEGGQEYTFKVTTKDASGNESVGAVKSIRLPSTGAGAGLLLLGSSFAAHRVLRRRQGK